MKGISEQAEIHPRARGAAALLAIMGTMIVGNVLGAAAAWVIVMLPLMIVAGVIRKHCRFVLTFVLPISCALFFVWWGVVGAAPGMPLGSAPTEGAAFAGLVSIRLALLGGISQLSLVTIKPDRLLPTLSAWGLRGELLVIAVSGLTLVQEMKLRAEQVLTARYARGFVARRSVLTDLLQLPFILRPLVAWVLRAAIQRGEVWQQRRLLEKMGTAAVTNARYSVTSSACYLGLAIFWFAFAVVTRVT